MHYGSCLNVLCDMNGGKLAKSEQCRKRVCVGRANSHQKSATSSSTLPFVPWRMDSRAALRLTALTNHVLPSIEVWSRSSTCFFFAADVLCIDWMRRPLLYSGEA